MYICIHNAYTTYIEICNIIFPALPNIHLINMRAIKMIASPKDYCNMPLKLTQHAPRITATSI